MVIKHHSNGENRWILGLMPVTGWCYMWTSFVSALFPSLPCVPASVWRLKSLALFRAASHIFFIGGSRMPPRMASMCRQLGSSLTYYLFLLLFWGMFAWNQNHCFSTISPGTLAYSPAVRHFQLSVEFHQPHLPEAHDWETWVVHISSVESSLSSLAWRWSPFSLVCVSQLASYWPLHPLVPWADVFITSLLSLAHSSPDLVQV